jgi:hypothetical protein
MFWGMKLGGGGGKGNKLNEGKAGSMGALRAKFGVGDFVEREQVVGIWQW